MSDAPAPTTEAGPSKNALKKQAKAEAAAAAKAAKAAAKAAAPSTGDGKKAPSINEEELDPSVRS